VVCAVVTLFRRYIYKSTGVNVAESPPRASTRIIAIGASAGGVEALSHIASQLPPDFPAAVFAAIHIPHNAVSLMPEILRRAGHLPAIHAASREPLRTGRIYIAPPDRHMVVRDGNVMTVFGPRENGHRPAIDPLFRSIAQEAGSRAIGVVLTGNLDDGSAGLVAIKERGGIAIVQDPGEAAYPGMPQNAIKSVDVDYILPLDEIVPTIMKLLEDAPPYVEPRMDQAKLALELKKVTMDPDMEVDEQVGEPSGFTCPECQGGLWEVREGALVRYRCRVGHAYSSDSLAAAYASSVEAALWAALRSLEENAAFAKRLSQRSHSGNQRGAYQRFMNKAEIATAHARVLRDILSSGELAAEPAHEVIAPE